MPFVESLDEFRERMNCPYIQGGGGYLFENGAFSDSYMHYDPPENEFDCLLRRRKYYVAQLERHIAWFNAAKKSAFDAAQMTSRNVPTITEQHIEELERLRTNVLSLREKVSEFDEVLAESPQALSQRQREAEEAERLARIAELRDRANQINI
ncbi:MAG: hypothetical protein R3C28_20980 [Pirellulaceae bacterium]